MCLCAARRRARWAARARSGRALNALWAWELGAVAGVEAGGDRSACFSAFGQRRPSARGFRVWRPE
eukprot:799084-Pyramimonas_sp.AAC.1